RWLPHEYVIQRCSPSRGSPSGAIVSAPIEAASLRARTSSSSRTLMSLRSIGPRWSSTETLTLPTSRQPATLPSHAVRTSLPPESSVMPQLHAPSVAARKSGNACRIMGFSSGNGKRETGDGRRTVGARDCGSRAMFLRRRRRRLAAHALANPESLLPSSHHLAVRIQHLDLAEIELAYRLLDLREVADHDPGQGVGTDHLLRG